MEQPFNHKKQTVTMEAIESAITSHRSLVSTWLEKSIKEAEGSTATKYSKNMKSRMSQNDTVEQTKHTGREDQQRTYSRLGIGAKHGAISGTSDSSQMQKLRERVMKQGGNPSQHSSHPGKSLALDKLDEMESRDKAVGQSKKRRL